VDLKSLVGRRPWIKERFRAWENQSEQAGVTVRSAPTRGDEVMAEAARMN